MKKFVTILSIIATAAIVGLGGAQAQPKKAFTKTVTSKWVSRSDGNFAADKGGIGGHFAHFKHRDSMKRAVLTSAKLPKGNIPATTLPVDCTNNNQVVCPMDGNDQYGICGPAMCAHVHGILTYAQGKRGEDVIAQGPLLSQYLQVSGGDNGTDESMLVGQGGIWTNQPLGPLAGDPAAYVVDSLDIDVTNVPLAQYAIDQFYTIQMAWSVPDSFINNFTPGSTYDAPATPDPANGHYTPLTNIAANGNYTLYTWGAFVYVTPGFVAAVQPQCFIVFSPAQFDPKTGYDSHGRHITTQAKVWASIGGTPIPQSVISAFPPPSNPTPPTPPNPPIPPTPPTPPAGHLLITLGSITPAGEYLLAPKGSVFLSPGTVALIKADLAAQIKRSCEATPCQCDRCKCDPCPEKKEPATPKKTSSISTYDLERIFLKLDVIGKGCESLDARLESLENYRRRTEQQLGQALKP